MTASVKRTVASFKFRGEIGMRQNCKDGSQKNKRLREEPHSQTQAPPQTGSSGSVAVLRSSRVSGKRVFAPNAECERHPGDVVSASGSFETHRMNDSSGLAGESAW